MVLDFIWPRRSTSLQTSKKRQTKSQSLEEQLITGLTRRESCSGPRPSLGKCRRGRSMDTVLSGRKGIQNSRVDLKGDGDTGGMFS